MDQNFQTIPYTNVEKEPSVISYISFILFFMLLLLGISFETTRYQKIVSDLQNPLFVTGFSVIAVMAIYGFFFSKTLKFKKATAAGTSAFIIAYFARLDLVFMPFFLVLFQNYYYGIS